VQTAGKQRARIESFDIMRGVIMVVMALDHTRDFWSSAEFDPTDARTTTVAYFVTRWITHLCAPWFMLLAGAGAALSLGRGRDKAGLTKFLLTRGVWLIALELTVVNLAWKGPMYDPTLPILRDSRERLRHSGPCTTRVHCGFSASTGMTG
jgi:uncharacterized membrane protein